MLYNKEFEAKIIETLKKSMERGKEVSQKNAKVRFDEEQINAIEEKYPRLVEAATSFQYSRETVEKCCCNLIGILAEGSSRAFKTAGVGFHKIIPISTLSGLILVTIMVFLVYYISITSYNRNLDPDNIVIPVSTSVTDSISSLILISVSLLLLGILV